eukprot:jgi/Chrzof1/8918/Cz03g29040.t1
MDVCMHACMSYMCLALMGQATAYRILGVWLFTILHLFATVRVEPEVFRLNGVYRLIYYYCGSSSDCGGVVAMELS